MPPPAISTCLESAFEGDKPEQTCQGNNSELKLHVGITWGEKNTNTRVLPPQVLL